jgi:hypothetical protein
MEGCLWRLNDIIRMTNLPLLNQWPWRLKDFIRMNNLAHLYLWLWRLKDYIGMDNLTLLNLWLWRLKDFIRMNNLPSLIYGCFHPLEYFRPSHPLNISVHRVSLFIRVTSKLVSNCPRVRLQYVCWLTVT